MISGSRVSHDAVPVGQIQTVEMEEESRRGVFDCANMTVIKHSNTNETFKQHLQLTQLFTSDQSTSQEEESKVSFDGEKELNILCHVDDPESSSKSEAENVCLLDNNGEFERDLDPLNPAEDQENKNILTHARTEHRGDGQDIGNVT